MSTVQGLWVATAASFSFGLPVAGADFVMTASVADRAVSGTFVAGETVSVDLFVAGSERAVCAVDLDIACSGSDLRIQSVSFAPAFSRALVPGTATPAERFRAVRAQDVTTLDRNLGRGEA